MTSALEGIRVIDLGQYLAAPLTAMMLCDSGADVIRIDPPGGPRWRHPSNAILQRGKRSVVLDLHDAQERATARALIQSADVVIEGFRPAVMTRLGLDLREMTAANPRLISCSLPGFGEDDPRAGLPAWEGVICAAAGLYDPPNLAGYFRKSDAPVFSALPLASTFAAFIAGHSIIAALIARERSGEGQRIEVPLFDACFELIGVAGQSVLDQSSAAPPLKINMAAIGPYRCADGRWIDLSPPLRGFQWFAEKLLPKEANESGLTDIFQADPQRVKELRSLLTNVFNARTAAEWERVANEQVGNAAGFCQTTEEWLHDPHAHTSGCVIALDDSELGPTRQAGYPVHLSTTPPRARGPRHGLDSDRSSALGQSPSELEVPNRDSAGSTPRTPLDGFRVIDTTQILAGPTACRILAEYGAQVIKISDPHPENPMAAMAHLYVNNGKRSILLDLKSSEGRVIVARLIKNADVFHQNFIPSTAERLSLGENDIRKLRPDIVYSSITCHANGGFRENYRGHEELGQALTGMQLRAGDGIPERAGWAICDFSTGHLSAFGILLALFHRMRTGEGQAVRAALSRSGTFLQIPFMIDFKGQVWNEPRGQNALGWGPLYRHYKASDRWFFLATPGETGLQRLAGIAGLEEIAGVSAPELSAKLESRFASAAAEEWVKKITAAGLGAHVLINFEENMQSPLVKNRGLSLVRTHAGVGEVRNVGTSAKFSRTPLLSLFGAPPLGWHSREILKEIGYGLRFEELVTAGVVATEGEH
jgi:crotonobetainyl-CoA:carnitine CoA-transferase CaiB-like acyl-CoA transferase